MIEIYSLLYWKTVLNVFIEIYPKMKSKLQQLLFEST